MHNPSKYFTKDGKPITGIPAPASATFLRTIHSRVMGEDSTGLVAERVQRDQRAFSVILLEYNSEFQITPTKRYIFIYAKKPSNAQQIAVKWWKAKFENKTEVALLTETYPQLEGVAIAEGIEDALYDDVWKSIKKKDADYLCKGDPSDPFAIMILQEDFDLHRVTAMDAGLDYGLDRALETVKKSNQQNN